MTNNTIGSGLKNLGNTCFFNAVMQIILHTPPLVSYLQSGKHSKNCKKKNWCIFCSIEKLQKESKKNCGVVIPKDIVSNLKKIFNTFRRGRQEDSHQFLLYLIQGMQQAQTEQQGKDKQKNQINIAKTITYEVFGGKIKTFILCLNCRQTISKIERYYDLSIQCQSSITLQQGLQNYFKVDQLKGTNKYRCSNCKKLSNAQKQFKIITLPKVISFQFKRFTNLMRKITKNVKYPKTVDLAKHMENCQGKQIIQLYGVIVHAGSHTNTGHYYAFVKCGNRWFQVSIVKQVTEQKVLAQRAYLLFYRRLNQTHTSQNIQNASKTNQLASHSRGIKMNGMKQEVKISTIKNQNIIIQQQNKNHVGQKYLDKNVINKQLKAISQQHDNNKIVINNKTVSQPVFGHSNQNQQTRMQTRKTSLSSIKQDDKEKQQMVDETSQNKEDENRKQIKNEKKKRIKKISKGIKISNKQLLIKNENKKRNQRSNKKRKFASKQLQRLKNYRQANKRTKKR